MNTTIEEVMKHLDEYLDGRRRDAPPTIVFDFTDGKPIETELLAHGRRLRYSSIRDLQHYIAVFFASGNWRLEPTTTPGQPPFRFSRQAALEERICTQFVRIEASEAWHEVKIWGSPSSADQKYPLKNMLRLCYYQVIEDDK